MTLPTKQPCQEEVIWFVSPLPSLSFSVFLAAIVAPSDDSPHAQIPNLRILGQTASFMLSLDHCPYLSRHITELIRVPVNLGAGESGLCWSSKACARKQNHRPVLSGGRVMAVCVCLRDKGP